MRDTPEYENCVFRSLESNNKSHDARSELDALNQKVAGKIKDIIPLSSFYLYEHVKGHYMASVLFKKARDLKSSEKTGLLRKLMDCVYAEMESAGFGKKGDILVRFNFESSESINSPGRINNIPTGETLAAAGELVRNDFRNLDSVCEAVREYFTNCCPLHNVYIIPQRDVTFRTYVFFRKDKDVQACKEKGVIREMIDFVYDELERAGRGKKDQITVGFEFDSDENVEANYEGDYFLRLR